jgi:RHS repeat-associated protein
VGDDQPNAPQTHFFDINGNLIRENTSRHFVWHHADRLISFAIRAAPTGPASIEACYLYDAAGQRVKKYVRNQQGQVEATVYFDGIFEHHVRGGATNNTLHVMENQSRIAMLRMGEAFPDDGAPNAKVKYHLGDHLGSSNIVMGGANVQAHGIINREEYFPYGESSFGSFARKRYRFTGKERDEETSLYYHGARYFAPWLARWVSCDPMGVSDGINVYVYVANRPISLIDSKGNTGDEPGQKQPPGGNIKENNAAGKVRAQLYKKHFEGQPNVEKVITESKIKDPITGKSVKLGPPTAGTSEEIAARIKTRQVDFGIVEKLKPGEAVIAEVSSLENMSSPDKQMQAMRDAEAIQRGLVIGDKKTGLYKITSRFEAATVGVQGGMVEGTSGSLASKDVASSSTSSVAGGKLGSKLTGGAKALAPMLFQLIWDHEHLSVHAQALEIENKRSGTVTQEEIEWMESAGWTLKGSDEKTHRLIWESSLEREIVDRVWLFLHIPDILMAHEEAERYNGGMI